jgi:hypothetical protein
MEDRRNSIIFQQEVVIANAPDINSSLAGSRHLKKIGNKYHVFSVSFSGIVVAFISN